jgi:hypothetical protein
VCPEHIKITDNAIIPLKERMATDTYDPIARIARKIRPRAGHAGTATGDGETTGRPPEKFEVKDVIRLRDRSHSLARVGRVLPDGQIEVWVLKMGGSVQQWRGPKVVAATDVANNYGPLDEVGIGSKLSEHV